MKVSGNTLQATRLDQLGYIPIVGTVSGACRIVYGIAKAVFSVITAVFRFVIGSEQSLGNDLRESLVVYHVERGLIELIPIVGGLLMKAADNQAAETYKNRILQFTA